MFLIPTNFRQLRTGSRGKITTLLEWSNVQKKIPWGTVILVGGGLSLAEGTKVTTVLIAVVIVNCSSQQSGLSYWLGNQLRFLNSYSPFNAMCVLTVVIAFLTEITSNVATASVLLPVINQIAISMRANPLLLMIPSTMAVSYAFMLPIATPPNSLVFDASGMRTIDMIKPGD